MKKIIFLGLLLLSCFYTLYAQTLPANFSNIKSASISDNQLTQIIQQMTAAGYTPGQFFELAVARGMNPSEANLVQERINKKTGPLNANDRNDTAINNYNSGRNYNFNNSDTLGFDSLGRRKPNDTLHVRPNPNQLQVYGAEIFSNSNLTFEPNLRIATPLNYIIGPDDEIVVIISGYQEYNNRFKVNPEGFISIPNVGVVYVAGLTFEEASQRIKDKLAANGYSNIRTGLTKVNITLGDIRSIHVTLIGEVKRPGTYTLPSLATVFNALYASGGPNNRGSFRNIEVIRNNRVVDTLDVYAFLSKGDLSSNILLADQDIIRIPIYTRRVTLKGAFKRPAIFEVASGETLQDVMNYAGGFSDSAATAFISDVQITGTGRRIVDIPNSDYATFVPQNADVYTADTVQDRYENRVQVTGAVFAPGNYAWHPGMTLKELFEKARGIKEEAYLKQGFIRRLQSDYTPMAVDFNVADVLAGRSNVVLQREDIVTILSNFDLRENFNVTVDGAVAKPGNIPFIDSLTLQDAILQAGGLTIGADKKIEISRRVKNTNPFDKNAPISQTIEVVYDSSFFNGSSNIWLQPYDRIFVKTNPSFVLPEQAFVNGEVLYPGGYTLQTKMETATSLIDRSGGLLPTANAGSAYLLRLRDNASEAERRRHLEAITSGDEKQVYITNDMLSAYDKFILNLNFLRAHPGSVQDVVLKPGDVLVINRLNNNVKVSGQVYNPSISVYEKGKSLEYYIDRAGGYAPNSKKKNTLVLYPNGEARKVSHFLFFKHTPKIEPGAEIIVPKEQIRERHRLTTSEVVAITGSVASLAAVVVALMNYIK
ncbi:capsule biosynthesis protein [Ilyomonas limi]|uniref:Capsule biosynthesis protein n=1 Tax=Ilyomonas limi TaxID=2575867 RepID=A0A4U3KZX2_9BACT|nr:SLBB domain-containing protein [Ilyomonas limi]TKK68032.1 capsule biosynthesis protein [Ilyomonas limi]